MSRLKQMDWRAWLRSLRLAHAERGDADMREQGTADGSGVRDSAERLERIAMYARAGYFNMGYTLDMTQIPLEIRPDFEETNKSSHRNQRRA